MPSSTSSSRSAQKGSATPPRQDPKAAHERTCETASARHGFQNDPDDPTNPNEAIERSRKKLRPSPLPQAPLRVRKER
jgi:hypothetical protein